MARQYLRKKKRLLVPEIDCVKFASRCKTAALKMICGVKFMIGILYLLAVWRSRTGVNLCRAAARKCIYVKKKKGIRFVNAARQCGWGDGGKGRGAISKNTVNNKKLRLTLVMARQWEAPS